MSSTRMTDAYVAGLIDGEGCIGIEARKNATSFGIRVDVGMSDKALTTLRLLAKEHGGSVRATRAATDRWESASAWTVNGEECAAMLRRILPHLVLKPSQARLALQLWAMRNALPELKRGARRWDAASRQTAAEMKEMMHELNRKGPVKHRLPGWFARLVAGRWVGPQRSLLSWHGLEPYSSPWPRAGMMLSGIAYRLKPSAPLTAGTGSSWSRGEYPTPFGSSQNEGKVPHQRPNMGVPSLDAWARGWPTPTAGDHKASGAADYSTDSGRHSGVTLTDAAVRNWPTPGATIIRNSDERVEHLRQTGSPMISQASGANYQTSISDMAELHRRNGGRADLVSDAIYGHPPQTTCTHGGECRRFCNLRYRHALNSRFVAKLMGFPEDWCEVG